MLSMTGSQHAEVKISISLGAALALPPKKGEDFVTPADSDGNLFDVIGTKA